MRSPYEDSTAHVNLANNAHRILDRRVYQFLAVCFRQERIDEAVLQTVPFLLLMSPLGRPR